MFRINENDIEYRHGDHGPKYFESGPDIEFGLIRLLPGEHVSGHIHEKMDECFYMISGEIHMEVNGEDNVLRTGDYIHVSKNEPHILKNLTNEAAKLAVVKAPFAEGDKKPV